MSTDEETVIGGAMALAITMLFLGLAVGGAFAGHGKELAACMERVPDHRFCRDVTGASESAVGEYLLRQAEEAP